MKIKSRQHLLKAVRKPRKRGFALIATLTLMMLLALIATALMATAASQNRIALQTVLQAEARQQALVGLDAAIGELQAQLGPDRRVSASSGIISESEGSTPQHILGVWNSWDGPIYGSGISSKGKIQNTYAAGRPSMFRKWLISTRDPKAATSVQAVANLCSRKPGQRICLVGEGTLGKTLNARHWVYADLLTMPSTGKNKACFAWWVAGENQKAKISVEDPEESTDPLELLHRTWNTPAPMIVDNSMLDFVPSKIEKADKLVTLGTLPLLGSSSQASGTPYFFDITTDSYSLPTNVSMGGLKQDLCLLLNKDSLKDTDFAPRSKQDCPIADNKEVPTGTEQDMPIGSWQTLYAYYNCWPDGSANDGDNFTARLIGSVKNAYTRMSGSGYTDIGWTYFGNTNDGTHQDDNSSYDARAMMDQGNMGAGYPRTPIMLAYMCNLGLRASDSGQTVKREGSDTPLKVYNLDMTFSPMFLYWNPYNVPMRVKGGQLWSKTNPYKSVWIEFNTMTRDNTSEFAKATKMWATGKRTAISNYARFNNDWGQSVQNSASDSSGDIVFKPGEVLFFSHPSSKNTAEGMAWSNPLALQFWPGSVSSFNVRMYSYVAEDVVDQAYVDLNLGSSADGASPNNDGSWFGVGHPECITLQNGYGGRKEPPSDDQADHLYRLQSPQRHILGWYDASAMDYQQLMFCTREQNDSSWNTDMVDDSQPYFIASVGVVAKSANTHLDEHIFPGQDFRGKLWAHATPATWGGALVSPSDQERQYHPYQLAALDVSGGLATAPMDNIGNNGYIGITSDGEQVSLASVMELPVHPPFSLAGLAGMRLTPGWYEVPKGSGDSAHATGEVSAAGAMRRSAYVSGVPGVGIGNALADPTIPATDVYIFHASDATEKLNDWNGRSIGANRRLFGDYFDHGLLINDALWDRWFMSSVSDMPNGKGRIKAEETLKEFLSGKSPLPVARYQKTATPYKDEQVISRLMEGDGWKYIAQYLMIDGGFNVNSISVDAWDAVLQGLARRKLVASSGNDLKEVESSKGETEVTFSRFMLSTTEKSIDGLGGYSMMQGSSSFRSSGMLNAWSEVRMLEPESIRRLAEEMVKQVRKRGPFLSMSDFINRRLEAGENGLKGALQAAIDATDINKSFDEVTVKAHGSGNIYSNPEAENGSMYTAAPGYLIQSDVLMSLGNILTVRDDTFTVRAYGCIKNPSNAILAQAWCEAVVQRTMDYVDPSNEPSDSEYNPDGTKGKGLSKVNRVLGRQFKVISFRWLDLWDI